MNKKEYKKVSVLPSAFTPSATYMVPHVIAPDEFFHIYEADSEGLSVSKWVTIPDTRPDSLAYLEHPLEIVKGSGDWKLYLHSTSIHISSFEARLAGGGFWKSKNGIGKVEYTSDLEDTRYSIVVIPRDILGTVYKPLLSTIYVTEFANDDSGIAVVADEFTQQGLPLPITLYNVPTDVVAYEVTVNEGSPITFPANPTIDTINIPITTNASRLRIVIRPVKASGNYYARVGTNVTQVMRELHDLNITATPNPQDVSAGDTCYVDLSSVDPEVTSYTIKVGGRIIDVVPNSSRISFVMPYGRQGYSVVRLIPNSDSYGLCRELLPVFNVSVSSLDSGGYLDVVEPVTENRIFRFMIRGVIPDVKTFRVYVNSVYQFTQKTLNGQVQITRPAGDIFNLTIYPVNDINYNPIVYTSLIYPKPKMDSKANLIYPKTVMVTDSGFDIVIDSDLPVNGYEITAHGVSSKHLITTDKTIHVAMTEITGQGFMSFGIKLLSDTVDYSLLDGVVEIVGDPSGYNVQLPRYVHPGTDITVHFNTNKPDIIGYTYSINGGPDIAIDLDANGDGVIHIAADLSPDFDLVIKPVTTGVNNYDIKEVNIIVTDDDPMDSGIGLTGRNYGYPNEHQTLDVTPGSMLIDRYEIVAGTNSYTVFELPTDIEVIVGSTVGDITTVSIQPFHQGTAYLPYVHNIETIVNPIDYNNTDANVVDSGLVFNIPDTVHRFDNINVDVDITGNIEEHCTGVDYYYSNLPVVTKNISDYMSPKITQEEGTLIRIIAVPKGNDASIKYTYTVKDVLVIEPSLQDSDTTIELDETVNRLRPYDFLISSSNPDVKAFVLSASNQNGDILIDSTSYTSPVVKSPVGTIINLKITPVSKTGIEYQPLHRTVKVLDVVPINANITINAPATVRRLEQCIVTWSIATEEDIIGVDLVINNINVQNNETFHIDYPSQMHIKKFMDYDVDTITSFTITPYSDSGIRYKPIKAEVLILPQVQLEAPFELAGKPDYNIASGEDLVFTFNNNLTLTEFSKVVCTLKTYGGGADVITDLGYDVSNYQDVLFKAPNTKGSFSFEPIGKAINGDPNNRKMYKPEVYSWNINGNITIDSSIEFGDPDPALLYAGYVIDVPVTNNPEGVIHFDIYINDVLIHSDVPMLGNNVIHVVVPNNIDVGTSVELGIKPLDPSNNYINYATKIIPLTGKEINSTTPPTKSPLDGATGVRVTTLITVGGYTTNGYLRAKNLHAELFGQPKDMSQSLTLLDTFDIAQDTSYNADDTQPDVIIDPNTNITLQRDWIYKLVYHYTVNATDDFDTDIRTTTFTTMPPNRAPDAIDDTFNVTNNEPQFLHVMDNDTDPDNDDIWVVWVGQPLHGATELVAGDIVKYTPDTGYVGTDTFSYVVSDQDTLTDEAVVTLIVANHNPGAVDDAISLKKNTSASINPLDNDFSDNNAPISILSYTQPAHGTISQSYNSLIYTPDFDFVGDDVSTYVVTNDAGDTDTGEITWTVIETDNPPVANDWNVVMPKNTNITIDPTENDTDLDNDTLTIQYITNPNHGTATRSGNDVTYTPDAGYIGTDVITYTINDGNGNTATANINYDVTDT